MERKRIPAGGNRMSEGLRAWKMHGRMEDNSVVLLLDLSGGALNGKKVRKKFKTRIYSALPG